MYHNIEKRMHAKTIRHDATYRGWDASGRFWFVGKGGLRGGLWWADLRDGNARIFGRTLREISETLSVTARKAEG